MPRLHLFEFEDQPWFPQNIRNYMTDYLQFAANTFDFYKGIVPLLNKSLANSGSRRIIDLASGGGGGWLKLVEHLRNDNPELEIILTDLYPNVAAGQRTVEKGGSVFTYFENSVDARNVPTELEGLRTQFLSFHHFQPDDAVRILANAVASGQAIAIFEAQKRNAEHFIKFMLSPIGVLLSTPFIRPFSIGRLVFTYLIPLVPLFTIWDGLVSVLRTYSVKEMEALIEQVPEGKRFTWETGEIKTKQVTTPYLIGFPRAS